MITTMPSSQVRLWQKLVAGMGSLVAAATLYTLARSDIWKVGFAIGALVVAAGIIHLSSLGAQVVARAVWWANLGLGTAFCIFGGHTERTTGVWMSLGCGIALLVIGRKGLAEASERAAYAPAAFRSSLLLLMALALADAQTVLLFAILSLSRDISVSNTPGGFVLLAVAIIFVVGFVGLYRLRLWGALLNLSTAVVFGLVVLTQVVTFDREISLIFMALCLAQIVAAAPMMIGLARGKPLPSAPAKLRHVGASLAVIALMVLSVGLAFTPLYGVMHP